MISTITCVFPENVTIKITPGMIADSDQLTTRSLCNNMQCYAGKANDQANSVDKAYLITVYQRCQEYGYYFLKKHIMMSFN